MQFPFSPTFTGSRIAAILVSWLAASSIAFAGDDQDRLLEELRNGNRATIESIRTLHCTITHEEDTPPPHNRRTGEYWRSGDVARFREHFGTGVVVHFLAKDGVTRSHSSREAIRARSDESPSTCDAWAAFLNYLGPGPKRMNLDTYLSAPSESPLKVRRVKEDGRDLIYASVTHAHEFHSYHQEIWFDPQVNYHWRKKVFTPVLKSGENAREESDILDFLEARPGLHIPRTLHAKRYSAGKVATTATVTLSNIRVNEPIPASVFRLRFPYGVSMVDRIQRRTYRIDEDGRPIGGAQELTPEAVTPKTETRANAAYTKQSESEPTSWLTYVLWGSLVVLLAGTGTWIARRVRLLRENAA